MNVPRSSPSRPLRLNADPAGLAPASDIGAANERRIVRKVAWRVMWFLCAVYFFSMMDRLNIAFAALSMNRDLGFDAATFGLAVGIMYVSYGLFGLPCNLMLERYGARRVISCIAIGWGIAATAMGLVTGKTGFLALRVALGAAEAGLVPGVMVYLSQWFPAQYRARFNATFILAAPVASVVTALLSTVILQMDNTLGIAGWRWIFLIEGSPAIVLGIVGLFYLSSTPDEARWLAPHEREWLTRAMREDSGREQAHEAGQARKPRLVEIVFHPMVLVFSLVNFCLFCGLVTTSSWLPAMLDERGLSKGWIGVLSASISLACVGGMFVMSRSSDRRNERIWHVVFALCVAGGGFFVAATASSVAAIVLGFGLATFGCFSAQSIFWTIPQGYFSRHASPAAIGMLSTVASIGSGLMPYVVGSLKRSTHSFAPGLALAGGILVLAAVIMWLARGRIRHSNMPL